MRWRIGKTGHMQWKETRSSYALTILNAKQSALLWKFLLRQMEVCGRGRTSATRWHYFPWNVCQPPNPQDEIFSRTQLARGESWLLLISPKVERLKLQRRGLNVILSVLRQFCRLPWHVWLEGFCSSQTLGRQFKTGVFSPFGSLWRLLNIFSASYF